MKRYVLTSDDPAETWRDDKFAKTSLDDNGIVFVEYLHGDIGRQHVPATIALYALQNCNAFLASGQVENREAFVKHSGWLLDNFEDMGNWGVWLYDFDFKSAGCDCRKPWPSGMMQGLGISVLLRYHALEKDEKALEVARKALLAYDIPMAEGGVLRIDSRGMRWYEEYPCRAMSSALNGFMFALVGAWEYHEGMKDNDSLRIFNSGIDTLKTNLDRFELKLPFMRWTRYDDGAIIHSGMDYHDIHVRQLKLLHDFCGDRELLERSRKWEGWHDKYGRSKLFRPYQIMCRGYTAAASKFRRGKT